MPEELRQQRRGAQAGIPDHAWSRTPNRATLKTTDVVLRLQTLGSDDAYWLDTGILDGALNGREDVMADSAKLAETCRQTAEHARGAIDWFETPANQATVGPERPVLTPRVPPLHDHRAQARGRGRAADVRRRVRPEPGRQVLSRLGARGAERPAADERCSRARRATSSARSTRSARRNRPAS